MITICSYNLYGLNSKLIHTILFMTKHTTQVKMMHMDTYRYIVYIFIAQKILRGNKRGKAFELVVPNFWASCRKAFELVVARPLNWLSQMRETLLRKMCLSMFFLFAHSEKHCCGNKIWFPESKKLSTQFEKHLCCFHNFAQFLTLHMRTKPKQVRHVSNLW